MNFKSFFGSLLVSALLFLLLFYWFIPIGKIEFTDYSNHNFSTNLTSEMQFYENMRYQDSEISYKIHDCPAFKEAQIEDAFDFIEERTILNFNSVSSDEEISAFCSEESRPSESNERTFIAGEGGPIKITKLEDFNIIFNGEILLIKESECPNPNVGIHEILHALGFTHSENPGSIMYEISRCNQDMGEDIINEINRIYSYPSHPDLSFEDVSAVMNGKYLDTEISIRNYGLSESEESNLVIYADDKNVKEFQIDPIKIGFGTTISLSNIWVNKISVDELRFEIDYSGEELKKTNNEIKLKIKN